MGYGLAETTTTVKAGGQGGKVNVKVLRWAKTDRIVRFEVDDDDDEENGTGVDGRQEQTVAAGTGLSEGIASELMSNGLGAETQREIGAQAVALAPPPPRASEATTEARNEEPSNTLFAAANAGKDAAKAAMIRPEDSSLYAVQDGSRDDASAIAQAAVQESGRRDPEIDLRQGELGEVDPLQVPSMKARDLLAQDTSIEVDRQQEAFGEGISKSAAQDAERALNTDARITLIEKTRSGDRPELSNQETDNLGSFPGDGFGPAMDTAEQAEDDLDQGREERGSILATEAELKLARVNNIDEDSKDPSQAGMNVEMGEAGETVAPASSSLFEEHGMMQDSRGGPDSQG